MSPVTVCKCGAQLKVEDWQPGKKVRCSRCSRIVTISENPQPSPRRPSKGKRRRMYLFERAYADYASRIKAFHNRIMSVSAAVWEWFWDGPGAYAIEILLRICVVLSGIGFAMMYVEYEREHGRGFSFGMVFAFILIAAYVSIIAFGWKKPVHWCARGVSAAAAAATVIAAGLLALGLAVIVFTAYLMVLFVATGFSFLVFLPMRLGQEIYMWWRSITYECPYDDCPGGRKAKRLPIHVCSCRVYYRDLVPSFYGIFSHTCRHQDGEQVKLPTMDWLGRNNLERRCAGCGRELIHSSLGDVMPKSLFIAGGAGAGKTLLLNQGIRTLCDRISSEPKSVARIDNKKQKAELEHNWGLLDRGQVLAKTAGDVMTALGVILQIPGRLKKTLLYLYDEPGEIFDRMSQFVHKQALRNVGGILLLVDPFSLPGLSAYASARDTGLAPSETPLQTTAGNIIQLLGMLGRQQAGDQFDIPLAVVMNKVDALPAGGYPYFAGLCSDHNGESASEDMSKHCRRTLEKLGAGNAIRALEQRFTRVRYFACSTLGRIPVPSDTSPFRPVAVSGPFLWLLGLNDVAEEKRTMSP